VQVHEVRQKTPHMGGAGLDGQRIVGEPVMLELVAVQGQGLDRLTMLVLDVHAGEQLAVQPAGDVTGSFTFF
jgi:hypothetical protein